MFVAPCAASEATMLTTRWRTLSRAAPTTGRGVAPNGLALATQQGGLSAAARPRVLWSVTHTPRKSIPPHSRTVHVGPAGVGGRCRSIQQFDGLASRGTATIEDAKTRLIHTRAALQDLPVDERKRRCTDLGVGGRILNWLWQQHPRSHSIYAEDDQRALSETLCWFLVPEDLEE